MGIDPLQRTVLQVIATHDSSMLCTTQKQLPYSLLCVLTPKSTGDGSKASRVFKWLRDKGVQSHFGYLQQLCT